MSEVDNERVRFILGTVGLEVWRACCYVGDYRQYREFSEHVQAHEPRVERVDIVWWRSDGELLMGSSYKLSPHGVRNVLRGPGAKGGPYLADGPIPSPSEPGASLQIAVFSGESGEVKLSSEAKLTQKQLYNLIWRSAGVTVIE